MNINNITPDKNNFLKILENIAKPPKSLWYIGKLPDGPIPAVAVVGTRKPSRYGQEIGYQLTFDLARQGVAIISGLALGMDAIAHTAALDAKGYTIAVMPCGLNEICPASHRELAKRILAGGGALVSEYAPGSSTFQGNFIARNRLVTGLSGGLLVIEAAAKSGTMHTARFALDQGRPVMAVPGNINSPMSEGCHNLIKTGARLITNTDDVLDEIGYNRVTTQTSLPLASTSQEQLLIDLLASGLSDGEELHAQSKLSVADFNQTLTMLEITGKVKALGANTWALRR